MVEYTYDPWGACTIVSDSTTFSLSTLNPFRYRGYYYDEETGLYYLQSRYYDPATCKFINADDPSIFLETAYNISCIYLWDYCAFNPVTYVDYDGYVAVAKDVIAIVADVYLNNIKCPVSAALFHHGLFGRGRSLSKNDLNLLKSTLKKSKTFERYVGQAITSVKGNNLRSVGFYIEFTQNKDKDLYFSLQHVTCYISGKRYTNKTSTFTVVLIDKYDFDNYRWTSNKSFASLANDFGVVLQRSLYITPYNIRVKFTVTWKSTIQKIT